MNDIRNQMAGYTILEAESHDAAAKMFLNHPGDGVEVMELLPIPEIPE